MLSTPSAYSSTLWSGRTVGLLGGSFNPAHDGHLHVSLQAMKHLRLDAMWWLVSPQNPLKPEKGMAPFASRMKGAEETAHHPGIVVSDIETPDPAFVSAIAAVYLSSGTDMREVIREVVRSTQFRDPRYRYQRHS